MDVLVIGAAKIAAEIISKVRVDINHIKHIHPQSEIMKLKCNYEKAKELLGWNPEYTLEEGNYNYPWGGNKEVEQVK